MARDIMMEPLIETDKSQEMFRDLFGSGAALALLEEGYEIIGF